MSGQPPCRPRSPARRTRGYATGGCLPTAHSKPTRQLPLIWIGLVPRATVACRPAALTRR